MSNMYNFDDMNDAPMYERGKFFSPGFDGDVIVQRCVFKQTRKGPAAFIAEVITAATGEKFSWFQSFKEKEAANGSIKEFYAAIAGIPLQDMQRIKTEINPMASALTSAAVGPGNVLMNMVVHLNTWSKTTKAGTPFTVHTWEPSKSVDTNAQLLHMKRAASGAPVVAPQVQPAASPGFVPPQHPVAATYQTQQAPTTFYTPPAAAPQYGLPPGFAFVNGQVVKVG